MTGIAMEILNPIYRTEIPWIVTLQSYESLLSAMRFISDYGLKSCLFVAGVVLFFLNYNKGVKLAMIFLLNEYGVFTLKLAFGTPRPYWIEESVRAFSTSGSFAMPSGHVLLFASVWLGLAVLYPRGWIVVASGLLTAWMGLSRVFLGVHFIVDVVMGVVFACLTIVAVQRLSKAVMRTPRPFSHGFLILSCLILLMHGAAFFVWQEAGQREIPESWAAGAGHLSSLNRALGSLFGLAAGWLMMGKRHFIGDPMPRWAVIITCLYGALGWFLIKELPDMVSGRTDGVLEQALIFAAYAVAAWWISFASHFLIYGVYRNMRPMATHG